MILAVLWYFTVKSSDLCYPHCRKVKKGVQMKRSRNVRKKKAIAKAISKDEKCSEKVLKLETKKVRVHSAKSLYD